MVEAIRNVPSDHDRTFSQRVMLRITNTTRPDGVTIVLEGRLAGPWVDELARCWTALTATHAAASVWVQLDAVTFIDAPGKELLRTMHKEGADLAASGCMIRAILEEIRKD
jgi:hypothetical protein